MRFINIALFIVLSLIHHVYASQKTLPEIQTKQVLSNIRYLSHDGKYTYFQQNGKLYLSTNYSSDIIHEAPKTSSFLLFGTSARKKLIIEEESLFHRQLSFQKRKKLYVLDYGKKKISFVAQGSFLSLNVNDSWINYYRPDERQIYAKSLFGSSQPVKIKLRNKINPFFIPHSLMFTRDTIVYNDINDQGIMSIFMYSTIEKTFSLIYKGKFPGTNLKFCTIKNNLIVGEFSFDSISHGAIIYKIPLFSNKNFSKVKQIYTSELDDIGNIVCSKNSLYFIKTTSQNKLLNTKTTEVAKLNLDTNQISVLTNLRYVTNIINMDGTILIPFRDKYFVAEGKSRLNDDNLIKK